MKAIAVSLLLLMGCAHATDDLARTIIPAFRAESAAIQSLADLDEQKQAEAKSKDEVAAWRKKYDEILGSFQLFHSALSSVAEILLTGKK